MKFFNTCLYPFKIVSVEGRITKKEYSNLIKNLCIPNDNTRHDEIHITGALRYIKEVDSMFMYKIRDIVFQDGNVSQKRTDRLMFEFLTVMLNFTYGDITKINLIEDGIKEFKDNRFDRLLDYDRFASNLEYIIKKHENIQKAA
jgi:hypothetical protein